ncbi:MAG: flagellin [Roseburia sp.]|nr:flagellin [Roseburia sp.]
MSGLVVNHNMASMYQDRHLKINTKKVQEASEKLATGYKVNRGKDDAAGLCVSETMRNQIRGLNRASNNIQDGISLVQTADSALEETENILDRMVELTTQAANDVNTEADRKAIQDEINQLNKEIDHVAYDTHFNQNYMLAEGTPKAKPGYFKIQTGSLAEQAIIINFVNASKESLGTDKVDVSSHQKAAESITMVQDAIEKSTQWRDEFGTVWTQLEHAARNTDNTHENTQRSESNIRDTDIGDEILGYTANQILVNASQSLLAQYNQSPQAVLMLLK